MASIELKNISKKYTDDFVLNDISFKADEGDFVILVGPSGCGKTTILKMIAGLEEITGGELLFDGERMNDKEPKDRDVGMVFQNYALYPHLSVFDNLAFPLSIKKENKDVIKSRVQAVAESLGLTDYLKKKPKELSGGQRQRVALGRALIRKPRVFLFDEPLSNLDAKLRVQMRSEITSIQRKAGITAVYVTHDQTEAMTMGSKIVVMDKGKIMQIGTSAEIYNDPQNEFVASFIGSPQINFFDAQVAENSELHINIDNKQIVSLKGYRLNSKFAGRVKAGIRPEDFIIDDNNSDFKAEVLNIEYLGYETLINFACDDSQKSLRTVNPDKVYKIGDIVNLKINANNVYLFAEGGKRIK